MDQNALNIHLANDAPDIRDDDAKIQDLRKYLIKKYRGWRRMQGKNQEDLLFKMAPKCDPKTSESIFRRQMLQTLKKDGIKPMIDKWIKDGNTDDIDDMIDIETADDFINHIDDYGPQLEFEAVYQIAATMLKTTFDVCDIFDIIGNIGEYEIKKKYTVGPDNDDNNENKAIFLKYALHGYDFVTFVVFRTNGNKMVILKKDDLTDDEKKILILSSTMANKITWPANFYTKVFVYLFLFYFIC